MDFTGPFATSGEGKWDMIMIVVDKLFKKVSLRAIEEQRCSSRHCKTIL
jgi:hypothetical protein